jgi:hypothetical protein
MVTFLVVASVVLTECGAASKYAAAVASATASPSLPPATAPATASAPLSTPVTVEPSRDPAWPPYEYPASAPFPATLYGTAPSCWLPVSGNLGAYWGEMVELPNTYPVGDVTARPTLPPVPAGYGAVIQSDFGMSYDWAFRSWLPVPWSWVTPDGKRYAYSYPGIPGILIADVGSNTATVIARDRDWSILDVEQTGIYATVPQSPGLWLVTFAGTASEVTASGFWDSIYGGAAYGGDGPAAAPGNVIERLDLATGTVQPWFQVAGATSVVVGYDGKTAPMILSQGQEAILWWVPSPDKAEVAKIASGNGADNIGNVFGDSRYGAWFMDQRTLWLYKPGYAVVGVGPVGDGQSIAGVCR